jgi:hypothetical protein
MKQPARPSGERYRSPHETFAQSPAGRQRSNFSPRTVGESAAANSHWLSQRSDDVRRRVEYADRWFAKTFHNWPRLARHSSAPYEQKVKDANQPIATRKKLLSKTLFTTDHNHNDSYLSNSPRTKQSNFQHSRTRQKFFSQASSHRIDQRNNTGCRGVVLGVGRKAGSISVPFRSTSHDCAPFPAHGLAIPAPKPAISPPIPPPFAADSGSNFVAASPPLAKLEVL